MPPLNGSPPSSKTSSTAAVSQLRPRVRRLISIGDELDSGSEAGASPYSSRTASPIPRPHPSRNITSSPSQFIRSSAGETERRANPNSAVTLSSIWGNSWSAIQDLASNVLGNGSETSRESRRRRPLAATHRVASSSVPPKQWGPSFKITGSQIGAGTQEEREDQVRALRRRDLLTAHEHLGQDSAGRIKRRNSDERFSESASSTTDLDQDVLVYIHHVRPEDTLAGITIRYNCHAAVLRKANRLWPNDSIQIKKTIILPVDACGVKGRPIPGPNFRKDEDLLLDFGESPNNSDISISGVTRSGSNTNGLHSHPFSRQPSDAPSLSSSMQTTPNDQSPWKHDSWVLLPNEKDPIEIGRMPRRALGFFPPARRKSVTYSDASTPKASLDFPRSSTSTSTTHQSHSTSMNKSRSPSHSQSHSMSQSGTLPHRSGRHRSLSNFSLHGPGGVGTLGKNVRSPGPAQDGLNKLFASHLPNVAPPPEQEYFTPWVPALLEPETGVQYAGSGARTPAGGTGLELENIGGAIEAWVRKAAQQASKMLNEQSATGGGGSGGKRPGFGATGADGSLGDLIELRDDAFDASDVPGREGRNSTRGQQPRQNQTQMASSGSNFGVPLRERGRRPGSAAAGGKKAD